MSFRVVAALAAVLGFILADGGAASAADAGPVVVPPMTDAELDEALATLSDELESETNFAGGRSAALSNFSGKALVVRGLAKNRSLSADQVERVVAALGRLKDAHPSHAQPIDNEIFKAEHLSIGRTAPEIEGRDIDGVEFKLSDYRGKVVVLDFWGDW